MTKQQFISAIEERGFKPSYDAYRFIGIGITFWYSNVTIVNGSDEYRICATNYKLEDMPDDYDKALKLIDLILEGWL